MLDRDTAQIILDAEVQRAKGFLGYLGIPLVIEPDHPTAFLVCWSNEADLDNIRISVHPNELFKRIEGFEAKEFGGYLKASLQEEAIHAYQLLDAVALHACQPLGETQAQTYNSLYSQIWDELLVDEKGRDYLTAAYRLYEATPLTPDWQTLKESGRNAYLGVEFSRMCLQSHLGFEISEAVKGPHWDPLQAFEEPTSARNDLVRYVISASVDAPHLSPTLRQTLDRLKLEIRKNPYLMGLEKVPNDFLVAYTPEPPSSDLVEVAL